MIDVEVIIARGYTLDDEYAEMHNSGKLSKLTITDAGKDAESIWIYRLNTIYFVFFNDPIMFWGAPRSVCGMLGIAHGNTADRGECMDLFVKAGQASIDYAYREKTDES